MIEIYPTRLLTPLQIQHILENWNRRSFFVKKTIWKENGTHYAMSSAFFRSCIPLTLHDMIYELGKRRFASTNMLRVRYHIAEVPPGAREGSWTTEQGFRCIVPLTEWSWSSHTAIRRHPELSWLTPGRLCMLSGNESTKELANPSSFPRIALTIHISQVNRRL